MMNFDIPGIIDETENFAVVFKPPKMHCENKNGNFYHEPHDPVTLFNWYKEHNNDCEYLRLMHRLDYETHGLVLFAKNEKSFNFFKDLQDKGEFVKEYSAITIRNYNQESSKNEINLTPLPYVIESYFRPYGPGRKIVRSVIDIKKTFKEIVKDKGGFYKTEIININKNIFTVRIRRGFRHQIRCHLNWIGYPILNDPLYPQESSQITKAQIMALRSHALFFIDPADVSLGKKKLEYRIESLS